ncbi:hypothetical protein [Hyphomicrobium denitrificans]|uniref:hypothetical protein n=1 Tax=Hyphomicrobium denitrificans TaxID=53399 RepID=UPI00022E7470|nr:hypothetical protein [Hyphomicrobium denitrificans]
MRVLMTLVASLLMPSVAMAADATCNAIAKEKNLHGAALNSFVTKCEKDAKAKCDADAKAKNLHGAAEKSFTTKCVKDASGT